jgi:hypothetical protein
MLHIGHRVGRKACCACLGIFGCVGAAPAWASPPREPLPVPLFSFDLASPSLPLPNTEVGADGLLAKGADDEFPVVVVPPQNLGLGRFNDDLHDVSFNRGGFPIGATFMLMFSVDRKTTGDVPPDPAQLAANAPFTVADQATRGHASGDGFLTLNRFNRSGVVATLRGNSASNTQGINNYDEGGHDFQAQPSTSARDYLMAPEDNVDAISAEPEPLRGISGLPALYYTVNDESTSLRSGLLPGNSGADIFLKFNPTGPQPLPQLYASAAQLGLPQVPGTINDIDGLIVFDNNSNGVFDGDDMVLFSLTPHSVALGLIPNVSTNGAADIFVSRAGPGGPTVSVFAPALQLGLAGPSDNVDGLELYRCDSAPDCALDASILLIKGDANNDGAVSLQDFAPFPSCLSGPREGAEFVLPAPLCRDVFDFNRDTDVDLHDFNHFQQAFGQAQP